MKQPIIIAAVVALAVAAVVGTYIRGSGSRSDLDSGRVVSSTVPSPRLERIERALSDLSARIASLPARAAGSGVAGEPTVGTGTTVDEALLERLRAMEAEVKQLRDTIENLVPAATVIEGDFEDPDGFNVADQYFEQGSFATAAAGYLKFIDKYPDHPDAIDLMRKARDGYRKAGYRSLAVDVQKRLLERYEVEDRHRELMTLAAMEKQLKRYDDAIVHVEEAVEAASSVQEALFGRLYRAWYVELRSGPAAGLAAYKEVQQSLTELDITEGKIFDKARDHVERLQKIVAAASNR